MRLLLLERAIYSIALFYASVALITAYYLLQNCAYRTSKSCSKLLRRLQQRLLLSLLQAVSREVGRRAQIVNASRAKSIKRVLLQYCCLFFLLKAALESAAERLHQLYSYKKGRLKQTLYNSRVLVKDNLGRRQLLIKLAVKATFQSSQSALENSVLLYYYCYKLRADTVLPFISLSKFQFSSVVGRGCSLKALIGKEVKRVLLQYYYLLFLVRAALEPAAERLR